MIRSPLSAAIAATVALEGANSGAIAGRSQADLIGCGGPGRTVELQL